MVTTPIRPPIQSAAWARSVERSILRQMIAVVSKAGILSFAGGLPDPQLFPTTGYAQALARVLAEDAKALQYNPPFEPLKKQIVTIMAMRGVSCRPEQVFLTTGAQQGLDILTRFLLDPGGEVMIEEIVYTGAQQVVFPLQPHILALPSDLATGMDVDAVEGFLAAGARPAYIYTIPFAHNPLGVDLSEQKGRRLAALSAGYGIPIIEDDPYGLLLYEDEQAPPLRSLEDEWVIYLGSFSKILAPALRLGWMIVPESLVPRLTVVKEAGDLESSALTQRAVSAYLESGALPAHIEMLRSAYGRRRDAMLSALFRYFPAEAQWTYPAGGMFIWVQLPEGIDSVDLLEKSLANEQVAFIPGHAFAIPGQMEVSARARNSLRLSFSNCSTSQIEDGIRRLAGVINRC